MVKWMLNKTQNYIVNSAVKVVLDAKNETQNYIVDSNPF